MRFNYFFNLKLLNKNIMCINVSGCLILVLVAHILKGVWINFYWTQINMMMSSNFFSEFESFDCLKLEKMMSSSISVIMIRI